MDISRKAELYETSSGLVTITGGKLTTWRRMAKMAVDRIVEREGREAPCRTARDPARHARSSPRELPERRGRGRASRAPSSPHRYGHAAVDVLELAAESPELAERISPGAARPGGRGRRSPPAASRRATLADVLLRRTRLGLLDARAALPRPAIRGPERGGPRHGARSSAGTTRAWRARLENWLREAAAERASVAERPGRADAAEDAA